MSDALDDFTRLTGALGDFAGSVFQLFDARIEAESAARAVAIDNSRTKFLMRFTLPRSDPNYVGTDNWTEALESYTAEVQNGFSTIKNPFVKGAVERAYSLTENKFRLDLAQSMSQAAIRETRDYFAATIEGITSGFGSSAEKANNIDSMMGGASVDIRKSFSDIEWNQLKGLSASLRGDAYGEAVLAESGGDFDQASNSIITGNESDATKTRAMKWLENAQAFGDSEVSKAYAAISPAIVSGAMDYDQAEAEIDKAGGSWGARQKAKASAYLASNEYTQRAAATITAQANAIPIEYESTSVTAGVIKETTTRYSEGLRNAYQSAILQLEQMLKRPNTSAETAEKINIHIKELRDRIAFSVRGGSDEADLKREADGIVESLKRAMELGTAPGGISPAQAYIATNPGTRLWQLNPDKCGEIREYINSKKMLSEQQQKDLDTLWSEANINAFAADLRMYKTSDRDVAAKTRELGDALERKSDKASDKQIVAATYAKLRAQALLDSTLNSGAKLDSTAQKKLIMESLIESAMSVEFQNLPENPVFTMGAPRDKIESTVYKWNKYADAGTFQRTFARDSSGAMPANADLREVLIYQKGLAIEMLRDLITADKGGGWSKTLGITSMADISLRQANGDLYFEKKVGNQLYTVTFDASTTRKGKMEFFVHNPTNRGGPVLWAPPGKDPAPRVETPDVNPSNMSDVEFEGLGG